MKLFILMIIVCFLSITTKAQTLGDKSEILSILNKVNTYYMANNQQLLTKNSANTSWLIGAYFTGHMALFKMHPTKEAYDFAIKWGIANNWALGSTRQEADNQCVGQSYFDIFEAAGSNDYNMLNTINNSLKAMIDRTKISDWVWIDALYMAMPTLTKFGKAYNDTTYTHKMYAMYNSTKIDQKLYDPTVGLWHRDKQFIPPYTTIGAKKCYWSRGNGWVLGALVNTLKNLDKNDIHTEEYITTFKAMAAALREAQRPDGFWNVSLADTTEFPGPETSGTAFFTYGLAWGINSGILDKDTYLPVVIKAWDGMVSTALHSNGKVGYVQGVAKEPKGSQPVTFDSSRDYGEGNFLLAGTEVILLAEGEMPKPKDFYVKSVTLMNDSILEIEFYEAADKTTTENIENYSITNNATIAEANLSADGIKCSITFIEIEKGFHGISFNNIKSETGKIIEKGSGKYFIKQKKLERVLTSNRLSELYKYSLFPNPATGIVHIKAVNIPDSEVNVCIYSTAAQVCYSKKYKINNGYFYQSIPLTLLPKGVYVLQVFGNNFMAHEKLVVE